MDMSKYTCIFKTESEKYIIELNDSLLALEKDPENIEQINTMFRTVHTFKGMASTMGFREIVKYTHEMENLIDSLRTKELMLNPSLVDIFFKCLDILEELVEKACNKGNELKEGKKNTDDTFEPDLEPCELLEALKDLNNFPREILSQKKENNPLTVVVKDCQEKTCQEKNCQEKSCQEEKISENDEEAEKIVRTPEYVHGATLNTSSKSKLKVNDIQSLRISTEQLNEMMNLVGELVINMSRINELIGNLKSKELECALSESCKLTRKLQEEVIEARMIPLDKITHVYPRMIRNLARVQNKKIDFIIKGEEIKLDKTILEEIGSFLVHLLRNAVDHGIELPEKRKELGKKETGTIVVTASRQENFVLIKIEDDGRGIDTEEILKAALERGLISKEETERLHEKEIMQLIFTPCFSTASRVTDISGRGMGMDIVKNRIECLGGSVKVESKPGFGSSFELKLPLTVALYQAMLIKVGGERYAIPFANIVKNIEIQAREIRNIEGKEVIFINNKALQLLNLQKIFQLPVQKDAQKNKNIVVVIVEKSDQEIGIVVDKLLGKQEIIVKNFKSKLLENTRGFTGATILGDGDVILIIDINSLT